MKSLFFSRVEKILCNVQFIPTRVHAEKMEPTPASVLDVE